MPRHRIAIAALLATSLTGIVPGCGASDPVEVPEQFAPMPEDDAVVIERPPDPAAPRASQAGGGATTPTTE
jgi:hypothetical protein